MQVLKQDCFGLRDEMCIRMTCPDCHARTLQPRHDHELRLGRQKEMLWPFLDSHESWVDLNKDLSHHAVVMSIEARPLFLAVHTAFKSLKVPSLIYLPGISILHNSAQDQHRFVGARVVPISLVRQP